MPLDLNDPRWRELQASYGNTDNVVAWLSEAIEAQSLSGERLGDLINEVAHQGDASPALYAVVPHLIELARSVDPDSSLELLIHAGLLCANTGRTKAPPCPSFLEFEYRRATQAGAELLAPLLPNVRHFDDFKYGVAGLAGLVGHLGLARILELLDFYQGEFHHAYFERPVPEGD
jgi:hypothetical protein